MEREILLKLNDFNKNIVTTAIENGIKNFLISSSEIKDKIEKLAKVNVFFAKEFQEYFYKNREDEEKIAKLAQNSKLILKSESWEIIPWENLIAKNVKFYVDIEDISDLKKAIGVLEKGVYGIIINATNEKHLRELLKEINFFNKKTVALVAAKIENIKVLDSGERVCVDTCNIMTIGEGMLVGSSSNFLFLVHSESIENPYCEPRPFRVNAGAVYCYIKTDYETTKYLSDLKSGDNILIVNNKGETRKGIVGRCKIETRPLILIEASIANNFFSVILQNAETINLVNLEGTPVSVTKLKKGDKVLVFQDSGARHFGIKIEEKIVEK